MFAVDNRIGLRYKDKNFEIVFCVVKQVKEGS